MKMNLIWINLIYDMPVRTIEHSPKQMRQPLYHMYEAIKIYLLLDND